LFGVEKYMEEVALVSRILGELMGGKGPEKDVGEVWMARIWRSGRSGKV
jgi:hypothetical protein